MAWTHASAPGTLRVSAVTDLRLEQTLSDAEIHWRKLEGRAVGSPLQKFDFVRAWFETLGRAAGARPLIITGEGFVIPLAVTRKGPLKVAQFPGDGHAFYNVGLFDPALFAALGEAEVRQIWRTIADGATGIDLVDLRSQPLEIAGRRNPFVGRNSLPAAHDSFDFCLEGGFDAVLGRHRGGKKRRLYRHRAKMFEQIGGHRLVVAEKGPDASRIVESFLAQKGVRLAQKGLPDVFADETTRTFFRRLADAGALYCLALEAGGEIRATLLCLSHGGTLFMQVNSFAPDEFERASPGEVLLHMTVENACASGFQRLDFGIGDARYKRSWADGAVRLMDTAVPLTLSGYGFAAVARTRTRLKRFVASDPRLNAMIRRLRHRKTDHPPEQPQDCDGAD